MGNDKCGHETADGTPCQNPASDGNTCWIPAHGGNSDTHGRPSKISKDTVDTITRHIAEGKSDAEAFRKANLHPSTKGNWLQKVDEPENIPKEPDFDESPFGYFFRRYTHARGLGEEFYTDKIMDLAVETADIESLMAMLKQRYPESWGDVDRGEQADTIRMEVSERVRETWPES